MPLLTRFFLLSYTNDLTGFSFHIFHGLDSIPRVSSGQSYCTPACRQSGKRRPHID
jgi:hypothetical protein